MSSRPLHGIPVGIKDVFDTGDMPTTYGSQLYAGNQPEKDAACVTKLRGAGAIPLGKTVTTEFAYFRPGKTSNPHNLEYTPGGSSSGSAAAVADFMVPVALGTQTAGSTIRPASYCGVVGFKPTYGLIETTGLKPLAQSLDTVGLFGRHLNDVARVFSVLTGGTGSREGRNGDVKRRFKFLKTPDSQNHRDAFLVCDYVASLLRCRSVPFDVIDLDHVLDDIVTLHFEVMAFEAWMNFRDIVERDPAALGEEISTLICKGREVAPDRYAEVLALSDRRRELLDQRLSPGDILLTPSAPGPAPLKMIGTGSPSYNIAWTLLHVPCMTIPINRTEIGLPVGIQLIGRRNNDQELMNAATQLQSLLIR